MWIGLLQLIIQLAVTISKFVADKQLIDSGVAQAIAELSNDVDQRVAAAKAAGDAVNSGGMRIDPATDPNNRDNESGN